MIYLFDTDVLIDFFKKRAYATRLVETLTLEHDLHTSVIVVAEMRVGWTTNEANVSLPILHRLFSSIGVTDEIAELGGALRQQQQHNGKTLLLPDALIAATAIIQQCCLVTRNTKDFSLPNLTLYTDF